MPVARTDDALVTYYSRSGTTRRFAEAVASALGAPIAAIRPRRERRYSNWLLRSFVPGSSVAVRPPSEDHGSYDAVVLCSPKWTLSCPPVNGYLDRVDLDGTPVVVVVVHAGFAVEAFVRRLVDRVEAAGGDVASTHAVHREAAAEPADGGELAAVVDDVTGPSRGNRSR